MRAIRSLEDAKLILQELTSWKDKLESTSWDFHGKRITNASPSKDPNDYVIRSEIPKLDTNVIRPPTYYTIEFCNSGTLVAGTSVSSPYCVPRFGEGTLVEAYFAATVTPVGSSATARLTVNGDNICATDITLPAGDTVIAFSDFNKPIQTLVYLDLVNINVITVGSTTPAAGVSISLRVQRV